MHKNKKEIILCYWWLLILLCTKKGSIIHCFYATCYCCYCQMTDLYISICLFTRKPIYNETTYSIFHGYNHNKYLNLIFVSIFEIWTNWCKALQWFWFYFCTSYLTDYFTHLNTHIHLIWANDVVFVFALLTQISIAICNECCWLFVTSFCMSQNKRAHLSHVFAKWKYQIENDDGDYCVLFVGCF